MPPHFRVIKLGHHPRDPTQVEADAIFQCRHIQFFGHILCIYTTWLSCQTFFALFLVWLLCRLPGHFMTRLLNLTSPLPLSNGFLTGPVFKILNVYAVPNGLTAKTSPLPLLPCPLL